MMLGPLLLTVLLSQAWQSHAVTDSNKLFWIVGGEGRVYLEDLADPAESGQVLPEYPGASMNKNAPTMVYLEDEKAVGACTSDDFEKTTVCHKFDGSEWSEMEAPPTSVCASMGMTQSVFVEGNGWWLVGRDASCNNSPSSNLYNGSWTVGPTTPYGVDFPAGVCVVQVNATDTMFLGGFTTGPLPYTWIYNWEKEAWHQAGGLLTPRDFIGCAVTGSGMVVAAGGNNGQDIGVVEIFDPMTGEWTEAGVLPSEVSWSFPKLLSWNGSVILLPADHKDKNLDVWVFNEDDLTWLEVEEFEFAEEFLGFTDNGIMVPDDFISM